MSLVNSEMSFSPVCFIKCLVSWSLREVEQLHWKNSGRKSWMKYHILSECIFLGGNMLVWLQRTRFSSAACVDYCFWLSCVLPSVESEKILRKSLLRIVTREDKIPIHALLLLRIVSPLPSDTRTHNSICWYYQGEDFTLRQQGQTFADIIKIRR